MLLLDKYDLREADLPLLKISRPDPTHADRPQQKVRVRVRVRSRVRSRVRVGVKGYARRPAAAEGCHRPRLSLPISPHISPYLREQVAIEDASAGAREYLAEHAQQAYRRRRSPPTWTDPADQP